MHCTSFCIIWTLSLKYIIIIIIIIIICENHRIIWYPVYASACLRVFAEIPLEERYNIWLSMRHLRSVILPCEILNQGKGNYFC